MARVRTNPLVANRTDLSYLGSFLKGSVGFSGGGCLKLGERTVTLSERGARVLASLAAATPDRVDQVERILSVEADAGGVVSPEEAAAILGVSRPTVVRWATEGLLADCKVGAHHRFERAEVEKLRDARLQAARDGRDAARAARQAVAAAGTDLDVEPTPAELIAAGKALRSGRRPQAADTLARARRAGARAAAQAAGALATGS